MIYLLIPIIIGTTAYILFYYKKFYNPYKLICLIGKKGSGKTTLLTKFAIQHQKKGWKVYSNFPCPGCWEYDPKKLGLYHFEHDSLVLLDEIGLVFNNRSFKEFSKDAINFFKLQRHYGVKVVACSQADDYDKVIRNLVDNLYLISNIGNVLSVARRVNRTVSIVSAKDGYGESRIVEDLAFSHWLTIPFGGAIFTWIPSWAKYFNSFDAPPLPISEFGQYYDERTDLIKHGSIPVLLSSIKRHSLQFFTDKKTRHFLQEDYTSENDDTELSDAGTESELVPTGDG